MFLNVIYLLSRLLFFHKAVFVGQITAVLNCLIVIDAAEGFVIVDTKLKMRFVTVTNEFKHISRDDAILCITAQLLTK